ncbi:MAG: type I pullulanase [Ruminococcus sp.]|nr:type I pullulanase [Ruminococcus sp.]
MFRIGDFEQFDKEYAYDGDDLGVCYRDGKTVFKAWSPMATGVYLNLYLDGEGANLIETVPMEKMFRGVWMIELMYHAEDIYYTFSYEFDNRTRIETIDLYARACGINGQRGYLIDLKKLDPEGWDTVPRPVCESPCDAVVYECHIRDFSIDESSGIPAGERGRFKAFTREGTRYRSTKTCLAHLKELGVTHVQLLPVFDYATVDESKPFKAQYNWGYDPLNYNCLEGSYSTDAFDPRSRIKEFKQLVMELHKNGIGVIMDVVYNHTYYTEKSAFQKSFPYYYHRLNKDGSFSNGSGCGNETASDHLMYRRFMINSLKFWAKEYKLDGFRFDLMALHDIETVNIIRDELNKFDPQLLMYGEGWTGGESPLPADKLAYKWNSYKFGRIGLFNDNIRDAIKGGTFNPYDIGYVSGNRNASHVLKRGLVGSVPHWQLHTAQEACWAFEPTQAVNYVEAHDNHTLWDKLSICAKHFSREERVKMDKLAAALFILAQGMPFIHLGQDFLRSKPRIPEEGEPENEVTTVNHNSYNAPDSTNSVKWNEKYENYHVFEYYRALIRLRRNNKLFRMRTKDEIGRQMRFLDTHDDNFIVFCLEDSEDCLVCLFNPYNEERRFWLPEGKFYTRLNELGKLNKFPLSGEVVVPPISAMVFKRIRRREDNV